MGQELTEERLQEYYADHPNADDSEKANVLAQSNS